MLGMDSSLYGVLRTPGSSGRLFTTAGASFVSCRGDTAPVQCWSGDSAGRTEAALSLRNCKVQELGARIHPLE
jgi:hypothetical protein